MKKIFSTILIVLISLLLGSTIYLSTIGIKTNKFNNKISSQIKKIDKNLDIKLKHVNIILNPFKFTINAKTIGANLIYGDNIIQLENIKSKISLKSLIEGKFLLTKINISTKSLKIKDLISIIHLLNKDPKVFIVKQFIKKGYVIADIEIAFDDAGIIMNNYQINGLVKDTKISFFKKIELSKVDFKFSIKKDNIRFNDLTLALNKKIISVPEMIVQTRNKKFLITGKINNKNTNIDKHYLKHFIKVDHLGIDIQEINFNSKNDFEFNLDNNFEISNLNISSEINLNNMKVDNSLKLKNIFPKIKKEIFFKNHQINLNYNKGNLKFIGSGDAFFQEENDKIEYEIFKNDKEIEYNFILNVTKNLVKFDLLNYEKSLNSNLKIAIIAKEKPKKGLLFNQILLKEDDNIIEIKNLLLSNNYMIKDFVNINVNFLDKENLKNKIQITKKENFFLVEGSSFNADDIIKNILENDNKKKLGLFDNNFKFNFNIKKVYFDKENIINELKGYLFLNDNKISELNLESKFSNQESIKLTIKTNGNEKITTLFSNKAKPIVDRYDFIKGFNKGSLDFYSIKKNNISQSILKIYDFKLKKLPVLTKILTLASLQGIADLLSGEGISFNEFEMKFSNEDNLMTIEEIYAIGPAISILMSGYTEIGKLVSLRGTLVPATTINKTIASIPILGDVLVGKKIGEGVFGVSFKIKGPPKKLQTNVNPIKTLTPRFITRTLEKIKKN